MKTWIPIIAGITLTVVILLRQPDDFSRTDSFTTSSVEKQSSSYSNQIKSLIPTAHAMEYSEENIPTNTKNHHIYDSSENSINRDLRVFGLPGSLHINMYEYRYLLGDNITADITLTGGDVLFSHINQLNIWLENNEFEVITYPISTQETDKNQHRWKIDIPAEKHLLGEGSLVVELVFNDGSVLQERSPWHVFESIGEVTGIGEVQIINNELVIPITIENSKPGNYIATATLQYFDKTSMAYLQSSGKLSKSGILYFKVDGQTIKSLLNKEQPLWIGNIIISRVSNNLNKKEIERGTSKQIFYSLPHVNPDIFFTI